MMAFKDSYFCNITKIEDAIKKCDNFSDQIEVICETFNVKIDPKRIYYSTMQNALMDDFFISRAIRYIKVNDDDQNDFTNLHRHNYIELIYVYSGTLVQIINSERKIFHKGDFCILDMNTLHQECKLDTEDIIIYFGMSKQLFNDLLYDSIDEENRIFNFLRHIILNDKKTKQYLTFKYNDNGDMSTLIEKIIEEYFQGRKGYKYVVRGYLVRMFAMLMQSYKLSLSKEDIEKVEDEVFIIMNQYIKENLQCISRRKLAEAFNFSDTHINRIIRKSTGKTYTSYINDLKMQKAKELLKTGDISVNKVINTIGYSNKTFFYKKFKDKFSMTPKEYQNIKNIERRSKRS